MTDFDSVQGYTQGLEKAREHVNEISSARQQYWRRALEKAYRVQTAHEAADEADGRNRGGEPRTTDPGQPRTHAPSSPTSTEVSGFGRAPENGSAHKSPGHGQLVGGEPSDSRPSGESGKSLPTAGRATDVSGKERIPQNALRTQSSTIWAREVARYVPSNNFSLLMSEDGVHIVVRAGREELADIERLLPVLRSILAKYGVKVSRITVNGELRWDGEAPSHDEAGVGDTSSPESRVIGSTKARY